MRSILPPSGIAAAVLIASTPVTAHHSNSMYSSEREIEVEGVVTKVDWVNPHIYISIQDDDGTVWMIEGLPPAVMLKNGWSADSVVPGEAVVATARPHNSPDRKLALGKTVLKEDGTQLFMAVNIAGAPVAQPPPSIVADGLSGRWLPPANPLYGQLAADQRPATGLTARGIAALRSYDAGADTSSLECGSELPAPYVFLLPLLVNIEIGDEEALIRVEGDVTVRTVHMNVASHDGADYAVQGHSIGWWDGDALVVDTTHFASSSVGHGRGLPSGPLKHVMERFALNEDRTALMYMFWVADPAYRSEPVTASVAFSHRPDLPWSDEPCDPEVARRPLGR